MVIDFEVFVGFVSDEELVMGVDVEDMIEFFRGDIFDMIKGDDIVVGVDDIEFVLFFFGFFEEMDDLVDFINVGFDGEGIGVVFFDLLDDFVGG